MLGLLANHHALWILIALAATGCTGFRHAAPGVYRSPFQREEQLIQRIEDHRIRTVLCLRGGNGARLSERACHLSATEFVAVPISAKAAPSADALLAIWHAAEHAERPVLVHCRAGVDRTGLACALFVLHDTGDLERARAQLDFWSYGHVPLFGTEAMDAVLDAFAPYAERMSFPEWVERIYRPERTAARL